MRLAVAVGSAVLCLLVACTSTYFVVTRDPTDHTRSEVVEILLTKGYTIDEMNKHKIETNWRKTVTDRYEDDETWYQWKLIVYFGEQKNTVEAHCMQQESRILDEAWFWEPCEENIVRSMVEHSAEDM